MSKKIENATVYIIRNKKGTINQKQAYMDYNMAKEAVYYLDCQYGYGNESNYYIDKVELPYVSRNIYLVDFYRGFDYSFDGSPGMYDVTNSKNQSIYPSIAEAKKDPIWISSEALAKEDPENHHVYPTKICSDDYGMDWCYGDVMDGKFSTKIVKIKVRRKKTAV